MNNVKPAVGGYISGNYLLSHNVNPIRNSNNPKYVQTYNNAKMFGARNHQTIEPEPPRAGKEEFILS